MKEITNEELNKPFRIKDLSLVEKDRLVGAFVWLIEEDKRQNPALYKQDNNQKE